MLTRQWIVSVAVVALTNASSAWACGPFFDASVLVSRREVLNGLRRGDIAAEALRLAPATSTKSCVCKDVTQLSMTRRLDLPDGRLYDAGAQAWVASQLDQAQRQFRAVLDLPVSERQGYSVAAAFMLGKLAAPKGHAWFVRARELADAGFADPLCLSTESWGEDGRQALQRQDDAAALHLYAAQLAAGKGDLAIGSMRVVAQGLRVDEARLRKAIHDPLVQQWLAASIYAAPIGMWDETWSREVSLPVLKALGDLPKLEGADRLAAAAWLAGQFALAERFAPKSDTPLGLWVQAKVALRHGYAAKAQQLLIEVESASALAGDLHLRDGARQDLVTLALGEQRYEDAALLALRLGDRAVVAQVVENLLDTDRAVAWVTGAASAQGLPEQVLALPQDLTPGAASPPSWSTVYDSPPTLQWLRHVLGRRLLREGRGVQAEPYFPPVLRARVHAYVAALQKSLQLQGIARAQALYVAAQTLHPDGMPLIGTELGPDWTAVDGEYEDAVEGVYRVPLGGPAAAGDDELVGPLLEGCLRLHNERGKNLAAAGPCLETVDEQRRVAARRPLGLVLDQRFHYRQLKSQMLEQAADLVPPHTQAFAALLCAAAVPVTAHHPERVAHLWRRYVREGALVQSVDIGSYTCPVPLFDRAGRTPPPSLTWRLLRPVKRELRAVWAQMGDWLAGLRQPSPEPDPLPDPEP